MNEIGLLVKFMRDGNRKEIPLFKYIELQEKKGDWSKYRTMMLTNQVQKSKVVRISYSTDQEKHEPIVHLCN